MGKKMLRWRAWEASGMGKSVSSADAAGKRTLDSAAGKRTLNPAAELALKLALKLALAVALLLVAGTATAMTASMAAAFVAPQQAWADEGGTSDERDNTNQVNPQQLPDSSFIYDTDIYALNTSDTYFDNQTVQVTGEIVGDRINGEAASGKCWLTLSALPDATASTVQLYVSASDAAKVDTFGRYGSTGTTVVAMGTYHLVCAEHDGLSDLHVDVFTVLEPGKTEQEEFDPKMFGPGLLLVLVGLGLVLYYRRMQERMR